MKREVDNRTGALTPTRRAAASATQPPISSARGAAGQMANCQTRPSKVRHRIECSPTHASLAGTNGWRRALRSSTNLGLPLALPRAGIRTTNTCSISFSSIRHSPTAAGQSRVGIHGRGSRCPEPVPYWPDAGIAGPQGGQSRLAYTAAYTGNFA